MGGLDKIQKKIVGFGLGTRRGCQKNEKGAKTAEAVRLKSARIWVQIRTGVKGIGDED